MLRPTTSPRVVDLGCGDGRLTAELARALAARSMLGVDNSPAMIAAAGALRSATVEFVDGDIGTWTPQDSFDVVFSNAALHWVANHEKTLAAWSAGLNAGGQIAVQVPANADHPAHILAGIVASEFLEDPPPDAVTVNVQSPERYAEILHDLGFSEQRVRLEVYPHQLATTADVVEWVKGSSLTRFKSPMGEVTFERFIAAYRQRVIDELGERSPFFYPFKRILMWGVRTG